MLSRDSSAIPKPIRAGFGLLSVVAARARTLPQALSRVPGEVLQRALQVGGMAMAAGGFAAKGYDGLTQRGEQTVTHVRSRLRTGVALPFGARSRSAGPVGPNEDPYMGGPLEPVADIREADFLSQDDAAEVSETADGATLAHAELPLEDYDHLTLGALRSRIRKLDVAALVQLREYEQSHANRLPVIKSLGDRVARLAKGSAPGAPALPPPPVAAASPAVTAVPALTFLPE